MKIAIAATTRNEDAPVSRHAARADCYFVYDDTGTLCELIENPFKDYARSVGVRVADYLAGKTIDIVAAGNFGTGFTNALEAKGIRHVVRHGIVRSVARDLVSQFGSA